MPEVTQQQIEDSIRYYHGKGDMEKVRVLGNLLTGQTKPVPEAPSVGRSFARGMVAGPLGLLDMASNYLVKPLADIPSMLTRGRIPTVPEARSAEIATEALDLPPPQTPAGRMAEIAGASIVPGGVATKLAPVGQRIATAGTEAVSALGAGLGQEVAGTPGMIVGGFTPYALSGAARQMASPARSRIPQQQLLSTFQKQAIDPTVGDISGIASPQKIAGAIPGGMGVMATKRGQQAKQMQNRVEQITDDVDDISAGVTIQKGIRGWLDNSFNPTARKLFGKLDEYVPANTPANISSTTKLTNEIVDEAGDWGDLFIHPTMNKVNARLTEASQKGMNFQQLRQLRSAIGRKLTSPDLIYDLPRAELKRLYGSLTKDIEETIKATGDKKAMNAFKKANSYWKKGITRVDDFLEPLSKKVAPEEAFQALERTTKRVPTRAMELSKSLKPKEREAVLSSMIRRMGEPAPGKASSEYMFSPETFLTNLNRIDDRAFKALSKNTKFDKVDDLNDLRLVADRLREVDRVLANPSGTAPLASSVGLATMGTSGVAAGLATGRTDLVIGGLAALGGTSGGAWSVAKLMSSPGFVKWVAQGMNMPKAELASHFSRLGLVAEEESNETQIAIQEFKNSLGLQ